MSETLRSLVPDANDAVASGVILLVYAVRILGIQNGHDPWIGLVVMADVIIPGLAVAWVFVMSMYSAYVALGEP